jgi:hypothetical protein
LEGHLEGKSQAFSGTNTGLLWLVDELLKFVGFLFFNPEIVEVEVRVLLEEDSLVRILLEGLVDVFVAVLFVNLIVDLREASVHGLLNLLNDIYPSRSRF